MRSQTTKRIMSETSEETVNKSHDYANSLVKLKTPEFYLDEAVKAKSEFSKDFKELMLKYKRGDCVRVFVESVIEEAMLRHSKEACVEQKQNSLVNFKKCFAERGSKEELEQSILNAKSPIE
ncbi:MAG TPA: hypothetical protein VEA37_12755 [Flavobacterium sp.]|nr:hypothetical protein [Flavobacterium sp.]